MEKESEPFVWTGWTTTKPENEPEFYDIYSLTPNGWEKRTEKNPRFLKTLTKETKSILARYNQ